MDMENNKLTLVVNLDLEAEIFDQCKSQAEMIGGSFADSKFIEAAENLGLQAQPEATQIRIVAFFARSGDSALRQAIDAIVAIGALGSKLTEIQAVRKVCAFTLVDCSDLPAAPLSDFNVLAHYIESLTEEFNFVEDAHVMSLDFESDTNGVLSNFQLYDTRSEDFILHSAEYIRASLRSINANGGQGDLPQFDND